MNTKTYNGHKDWTHWNVSLWVNNDEPTYRLAQACVRLLKPRRRAAEAMLQELHARGITATPDGARYSVTSLLHAMRGMGG